MILLPHNCKCSNLTVNPSNWKTGGKSLLKKSWRITYRFYDPRFPDKPEWGKQISIKGMNDFKTLEERRDATNDLIENELYMLKVEGWNPITKTFNGSDVVIEYEIHPKTLFCDALEAAYKKLELAPRTLLDIKGAKKYFVQSLLQLRFEELRITDVKRKHVRMVLENQSKHNKYSNDRFNKVRAYMGIIFKVLVEHDAIEHNPIVGISKKKTVKKIKQLISDDELIRVKEHLKSNYYTFYRYMEIFFHSGSRSSELFRVKRKDVFLEKQLFKVLVLKGGSYEEQWRAINKNVLSFWFQLCSLATPDEYLFSKNLEPGTIKIEERQISNRWRNHVKKKLGVKADFYSLKHLHTTKITEAHGKLMASNINGHKSTKMNDEHYDVLRRERLLEEAKRIEISL